MHLNKEEFETVQVLKNKFGINLTGSFKMFLRKYKEFLEENDKNIQI